MGHVFEDWQIRAYINMVRIAKKNYVVSGLLFFLKRHAVQTVIKVFSMEIPLIEMG